VLVTLPWTFCVSAVAVLSFLYAIITDENNYAYIQKYICAHKNAFMRYNNMLSSFENKLEKHIGVNWSLESYFFCLSIAVIYPTFVLGLTWAMGADLRFNPGVLLPSYEDEWLRWLIFASSTVVLILIGILSRLAIKFVAAGGVINEENKQKLAYYKITNSVNMLPYKMKKFL